MKYFKALHLVLMALPTAILADCPDKANLATGIRFGIDGGDSETFRTRVPGVIAATYSEAQTPVSRVLLGQGVYLLELIDLENGAPVPGTRTTYSYPSKPADLPVPQSGGNWSVTAAVFDRGELRSETQSYRFGPLTQVSYGACRYDMFTIEITYPDEREITKDLLHYLPALGLSYLAKATYDNTTDTYKYISIETVK